MKKIEWGGKKYLAVPKISACYKCVAEEGDANEKCWHLPACTSHRVIFILPENLPEYIAARLKK